MSATMTWVPSGTAGRSYSDGLFSTTGTHSNASRGHLVIIDAARVAWEFRRLSAEWKQATINMSCPEDMFNHPAYRKIIALGHRVVPLLLQELSEANVPHWFVALSEITGQNPVDPEDRGRMKKMAQAWINWGRSAS